LTDIAADPRASLLVDDWDEDWSALWWVRLAGRARIVDGAAERADAIAALTEKYQQYRRQPPDGPVLALDITAVRAWSASGTG
jgi:PPOX class probable F420-dependent enzyme